MRIIHLIFVLFAFQLPLISQQTQPTYLGKADWRKISGQSLSKALVITQKNFPVTKVVSADKPIHIYQRKIDPGTITLRLGPTKPLLQSIRITGTPLSAPTILPAPPLLTRDNASFNVSYTDKKHGFAANFALDFAEDDMHNIWIASEKGLIKYDGYTYSLYHNKINMPDLLDGSLAYDHQKRLWLASENGVYYIKNDSLFTLQSPEINFSNLACKKIYIDNYQRVWIATKNKGVLCIEGSTLKIYDKRCGLPGNYIESVYLDSKGRLLLGCRDFGIVIIEPQQMRMFFSRTGNMKYHIFLSFYEDEAGIWTGSFLSGMMRLGRSDTLQYSVTGKYNEALYDIKKAPGGLWLSCYSQALCYFTKEKLLLINENNGLLNNLPYRIFTDSYQNLWVSNGAGFSRINEDLFYLDDFPNPALGFMKNIIPDKQKNGNWIISFGRNLQFQKGNEVTTYTYTTPSGIQPFLYCTDGVLSRDGNIWMGTFGEGIVQVKGNTFTQYNYSNFTDDNLIRNVVKDSSGNIWFSPTKYGLIEYTQNQFRHYTAESGLQSDEVTNLFVDREGKINISYQNGFQRLDGSVFENFYIGNRMFRDQVNAMLYLDTDTRLLATNNNGVLILNKQKVYQFSQENGLASNLVKTMIRDASGRIWLTTENGIESLILQGLSIRDHRVYNVNNGSYIIDAENAYLDSNGLPYWTVGRKKLVFNEDALPIQKNIPIFSFKAIEIDSLKVSPEDEISILPNQKITFHYRTIDWGRENNLKVKYLLISKKNDTTERPVQNSGSIIINDILPGHYRIFLKATDNNDVYYSNTLNFTIRNFWYNTWLFRIIIGSFIITGIVMYFRQKAKRNIQLNEQLKTKVREQTEFIEREKDALLVSYHTIDLQNREKDVLINEINHRVKNNLQFIAAILELQLDNQVSSEVIQALLETSRRIKAMSLVHELLYTKKEQQGLSMQVYVHELVDNLTEMAVIEASPVNRVMDIDDILLDSKTALSLGMIISELVSNSFKHAFANVQHPEIRIQLKKDPAFPIIRLIVSDNGSGFLGKPEFPNGLGSSLVDIFSRQLEGSYTKHTIGYFHFELQFNYSDK